MSLDPCQVKARFGQSHSLALVFLISEMGLRMDPLEKFKSILKEKCCVPTALEEKDRVRGRGMYSSPRQISTGGTFGQREGSGQPPVGLSPGWWAGSPCRAK